MAGVKASYIESRLSLGKVLPINTPLSVILDISERCNFKCNYCFRSVPKDENWGYAAKNNIMSMDIFQKAVGQLSDFPQKIKSVSLSGHGEPLCNPEIVSMVKYLKRASVTERIEMHTNASLLTEKSAEDIAQAGFTRIVVSLQGTDSNTYGKVCGVKLNWDLFYKCLQILYADKNDSLQIHIKISEAAFPKENYTAEEKHFYSLFEKSADTISVEKVTPLWKNMDFKADEFVNKYGHEVGKIECCPILFYKIWIAPDGEIYPCTGLPAPMSLGNIHETTLYEAWNGIQRSKFLEAHLRSVRGEHPACQDCFVPVNTVTMQKDIIDPYRKEILERLEVCQDE